MSRPECPGGQVPRRSSSSGSAPRRWCLPLDVRLHRGHRRPAQPPGPAPGGDHRNESDQPTAGPRGLSAYAPTASWSHPPKRTRCSTLSRHRSTSTPSIPGPSARGWTGSMRHVPHELIRTFPNRGDQLEVLGPPGDYLVAVFGNSQGGDTSWVLRIHNEVELPLPRGVTC